MTTSRFAKFRNVMVIFAIKTKWRWARHNYSPPPVPPRATAGWDDETAPKAHSCANTCVSHILQRPHFYATDLSGMLVTDENVRRWCYCVSWGCRPSILRHCLLTVQKDGRGDQKATKEKLLVSAWIARRTLYDQWEHMLQELTAEVITSLHAMYADIKCILSIQKVGRTLGTRTLAQGDVENNTRQSVI